MIKSESLNVELPADLSKAVQRAIADGDYASPSDIVRSALHEWQVKRSSQDEGIESLRADMELGLRDIEAGRVSDFDAATIVTRGRARLADRSSSA